jgi:polysaccharide biosynthesis PFTS motif protein
MLREKVTGKKIIFPLKKSWINILKANSFKVSSLSSRILYILFLIALMLSTTFKSMKYYFLTKGKPQVLKNEKVVYIDDLTHSQLNFEKKAKYSLVQWLLDTFYSNENLCVMHKNATLKNQNIDQVRVQFIGELTEKARPLEIIKILIGILKYLTSERDLLAFFHFPNLWTYFKIIHYPEKLLAKEFIFNCSRGTNMPLWVHALIQKNFKVIYLFYALYTEPNFLSGKIPGTELWKLSTWPSIIGIDNIQKNEIFRDSKLVKFNFDSYGVPWWQDSNAYLVQENKKILVLFDSIVGSGNLSLAVLDEYGLDQDVYIKKYFDDVVAISKMLNLQVLIKFKRDNYFHNPAQVQNILNQIKLNPNMIKMIQDDFSPLKMIQSAKIVICKPFSTIGMIAKNEDVPVIQYNSTPFIISDSFHSQRNISLANSFYELEKFCRKAITI